jgi:competence protein ComGC
LNYCTTNNEIILQQGRVTANAILAEASLSVCILLGMVSHVIDSKTIVNKKGKAHTTHMLHTQAKLFNISLMN